MAPPDPDVAQEIRLLVAVGNGDRDAFRDVYARYSAPLFSFAVRLVGDNGAAEEVLQDAFVKIWRHARSYEPSKSRPFTWAVTIVRRTGIDYLRKHQRVAAFAPLPDRDEIPSPDGPAGNPRIATETRESAENVHEALAALAPPQRDALELALFSTLTHAEIAERLAQPLGSVKTWIRRGLLELRATLNESVS